MRGPWSLFAALLILSGSECAASQLTISVTSEGQVNASLLLDNPVPLIPESASVIAHELFMFVVPFDVIPEQKIVSAADVYVQRMISATGASVFAVLAPTSQRRIPIEIRNCSVLRETSEGKAKLDLDFGYTFLPESARALLTRSAVVSSWNLTIHLPREYNKEELSYEPIAMVRRLTGAKFFAKVGPSTPVPVWVVFPNPTQQKLSMAKLVASLLFGFLTLIIQVPALKARRVGSLLAIMLVSIAVLSVSAYYSLNLAKRLDFLEWSAALIPHTVFALGATIYVLFAKRKQGTVTGVVLIDGQLARFADVRLYKTNNGQRQEIRRADTLTDGRYLFHVWCGEKSVSLVVTAIAGGTAGEESQPQMVGPSDRIEVAPLELKRLPIISNPMAAQSGGGETGEKKTGDV